MLSAPPPTSSKAATPRLELRGITKHYPGVTANDGVNLVLAPGEIHAVLGENGAGKSTMMKIIHGAVQADAGDIRWEGKSVSIKNPSMARDLGISMVYQHFALFETLSASENVWLGLDKTWSKARVVERMLAVAREFGVDVEPERPVHTLSVGERQRVEIIRALLTEPRLLILDEPTSVLTPQAVEKLFETLRRLQATGCSILYISHKLNEIRALCETCTVMRGGKVTGVVDPRRETDASLSRLMIGTEPPRLQRQARQRGDMVLEVQGLTLAKEDQFGTDLHDIRLDLHAGEIVGLAGVSGNGQQELMACLSGEDPRTRPGVVTLLGEDISRWHAADRRRAGLRLVPEERLGRGAVPSLSLADNTLLTGPHLIGRWGWIDRRGMQEEAKRLIERFQVKATGPGAAARSLSGGNLQKFIVGREVSASPKVLLVSQPTWGVDVGAAARIRADILALRDAGCAILVVSEELDELFEISDRLLVLSQGRISPSLNRQDASIEQVGLWMSGLWHEGLAPQVSRGGIDHAQA